MCRGARFIILHVTAGVACFGHIQVVTLVSRMAELRGGCLTTYITSTLASWMESVTAVESCRREEIINAINRHRARNVPAVQKDTG